MNPVQTSMVISLSFSVVCFVALFVLLDEELREMTKDFFYGSLTTMSGQITESDRRAFCALGLRREVEGSAAECIAAARTLHPLSLAIWGERRVAIGLAADGWKGVRSAEYRLAVIERIKEILG